MARQVRDVKLETRNARRTLKVGPKPYWRALDKGLHLGYRRRPNGGSWIVRRLTEAGKYAESKLGAADDFQDADGVKTLDYREAQEAARRWYHGAVRIEAGIDEPVSGPYTVAEAMRDYLEHYKVEGKGLSVANAIINAHILPELGPVRLDRLTSKKIFDWMQGVASRPPRLRSGKNAKKLNVREVENDADTVRRRRATANRVLTVLKAALNYAFRNGRITSDTAWRKVKPFKSTSAPVIRYLNEQERVRLVNACSQDLRRIVQAALFTGCRYGELANLKTTDVDLKAGTVAVRVSKSGQPRHVYLTEEGQQFFKTMIAGKKGNDLVFVHGNGLAWGKSHQHRPLQEACANARIKPAVSFHILRHTHGSILAMKGVPMAVIAKQLGHSDTRMTEKHYAHLAPSYVADTIRAAFGTLGIVKKTSVTSTEK